MARLVPGDIAPDFSLSDQSDTPFHLADWRGDSHVLLVLNRGLG